MKKFILLSLSLLLMCISWYVLKGFYSTKKNTPLARDVIASTRVASAAHFVTNEGLDTEFAFFINMKNESGSRRFYVVNLKTGELLHAGLVAHGRCNKPWLTGRKYGNEIGCGCSSLGRYRVGNPYKGRFGLAYKLHGLDATNSNAFKRFVVLHAHDCVPYNEVSPAPICQSDGCPTVAPQYLQELKKVIEKARKPVLLWMYED